MSKNYQKFLLGFCLVIVMQFIFRKVISYDPFCEQAYDSKMSYGTCLRAMSHDLVYSMEVIDGKAGVIVTLQTTTLLDKEEDKEKIRYKITDCDDYTTKLLLKNARDYGIEIIEKEYPEEYRKLIFIKIFILFIVLGIPLLIYIFYKKRRNKVEVINGVSGDTIEESNEPKVTFDDVAALDEEKAELVEIVDFIRNSERYTKLGAKSPKGVLLVGNPGTGKTLLAKAVAGEAGVTFISASGSEFINVYGGKGAANVRKLFKRAREQAPCIVFIDEIDSVGGKRPKDNSSGNGEYNQTINQLLTELDGFQSRNDIIILAATNNPDILDSALTRPGRFDRIIYIGLPDFKGRRDILKVHSKNKPFFEDVDLDMIAKNTVGFTGAQLENLLNEAAIYAVRNEHIAISNEDLNEAFRKITIGIKKANNIISEEEKRITASHEAGHAIVSLFMPTQPKVKEVSINSHNADTGYTWHEASSDRKYNSKTELLEKLTVLMAGRVTENIIIGDVSTGSTKDIEEATRIAMKMVYSYGMDTDIGPISIKNIASGRLESLSEKTLETIEDKVTNLLKNAEKEATKLINDNRPLVTEVIQFLLKEETMTGEELQNIYDKYKK